jgi:hypothetical protein
MTHRIHLRGHWEVSEPMPGRVRFIRRFGRPRMSDAGSSIQLVISGLLLPGTVRINSSPPIPIEWDPFSFDPGQLQLRNDVTVEGNGDSSTPPPELVMEIEEAEIN